jgi:HK97 family phage major capsid protein/HK97 family phage prohead protease
MTEQIKVGRLARDFGGAAPIEVRRQDGDRVSLSFPASSETPVERFFGTEVLSHKPGAVRMDRLTGGAAPLLFNHDWSDPVGMVEAARLEGGRLVVDARMFTTARAREVADMVEQGLRNVSIGYEIEEMTEDSKRGVYTATRWTPLEVSVVTVPADASVGVGRAGDNEPKAVRVVRAELNQEPVAPATFAKESTVDESKNAATGANVETRSAPRVEVVEDHGQRQSAMQIEQSRVTAIRNLCQANNIDQRTEVEWVRSGTQLEEVAQQILGIQVERQKENKRYASELGLSANEAKRYSLFRALRAQHFKTPESIREAAFEIECSREIGRKIKRGETSNILVPAELLTSPHGGMRRDMATTPGASGGYMVETQNMGFLGMLRNKNAVMMMGATTIALEGNAAFVRQTGSATIRWQAGEHTATTKSDQTLGQLSMTPKTAIAWTKVSEQLLRQSSPSAEQFVMNDLAQTLASGIDYAAINGTGGAMPLGILNTTGVTTSQDASSATYAKLLAFWSTARGSNAVLSNPGWLTNAAGAAVLLNKQRFTSTDTPLWVGSPEDGRVVDFRAVSTQQVQGNGLIFGSWGEVLVGEWGVLELSASNGGEEFESASVKIRAMWMVDVLVRYPQAFVVSSNLSA